MAESQDEIHLVGQPGKLFMTIEIKRAATGETETYELIGKPIESDENHPEEDEE